ncbi:MAG: YfcE family phosphodiesterase [Bacteroidetes bacterium GWF2_42_66]|nr:MAG: YfcE family phosphodiesterase [Bacteroidetes bacterium GWA2_42_15]OFX98671.1 MAG: YfcE family phosphodiesterase [Bacteroidetes bacterium GWE2_42_39]OFY43131.1 MAG: YfcE family phosphodiesterase [Bacteroidetes bacterium GWF2_42_66]HBL77019.1 YfcE family phosphodiesterase [Prolixibacteraceae bacterium]HCR90110.1 YfcE family phosphodiesterase [Prolixibacteraceae bacterium]
MKRIGLLSDTHGTLSNRLFRFFENVDEIWHAGDIGDVQTADRLSAFKPLRAVYGNIDDHILRRMFPETLRFQCENVDVLMTHIGGYPGHYERHIYPELVGNTPQLFIAGHSHILKVIFDKKLNFLHINPGAAGNFGFQNVCTALRFKIDGKEIKDLEIWEMKRNNVL